MAACERRAWTLRRAGLTVDTTIRSGRVPEAIGARALEIGTDVIVMASHDRSRTDRLLRRNAAIAVVRRTELPVLLAARGRGAPEVVGDDVGSGNRGRRAVGPSSHVRRHGDGSRPGERGIPLTTGAIILIFKY